MRTILAILGTALIPVYLAAGESPLPREYAPAGLDWGKFQCDDQTKRHCKNMVDCDEATFHWAICNRLELDGDEDNMPCERVCPRVLDCDKKHDRK